MEILQPGVPKSEKQYTVICRECKCQYRFKRSEAQFVPDQRDGDGLKVRCPQHGCGSEAWVPA